MLKRIVPVLCCTALAAACSGSGGGSSSSGGTGSGTGTGSSSGTATGGSSGGSTGSCVTEANVADIRAAANDTVICASNLTVLMASSYGSDVDGGGTQYYGNWYMADSTGATIAVFHDKKPGYADPGYDPTIGDVVNVTGEMEWYPTAMMGQQEVEGHSLAISKVSSGATLPTPMAPSSFAAVAGDSATNAYIGQYVTIPAGTYTEDYADPAFTYMSYQDGVSIKDSSGNTLHVEMYTFEHGDATGASGTCYPIADGGFPDLTAGGFNGVLDREQADDMMLHNVLFYDCGK